MPSRDFYALPSGSTDSVLVFAYRRWEFPKATLRAAFAVNVATVAPFDFYLSKIAR